MKNYAVNSFAGGMNNLVSPRLLPENTAQLILNGDVSTGSLKSIKGVEFTGQTNPVNLGHYGAGNRSVVSWYKRTYWSVNDAEVSPYYGGDTVTLGIIPPTQAPVISANGVTGLTGTFKYCWTYLNADGFESAPHADEDWYSTITLATQAGSYTLPTEFPENVDKIRIYRTVDEGNTFYYINEHDSEDAGSSFNDTGLDLDILMRETMNTLSLLPPPDGGKYLIERDGVFWLAVGDRLYFSEVANPHAWNPINWIGMGDTVTCIGQEFTGIMVFTNNTPFRVTGTDADTVMKMEIPSNQGCPNYRTFAMLSNAPVWQSNDGVCLWDGSAIKPVNFGKYNIDFTSSHAVSGNDAYYLFHDSGCLCFDRRSGDIFKELDITSDYAWYDANADSIYLLTDADGSDKIYEMGTGNNLTVTYQSPQISGSGMTQKQFRRIFVNSDCSVAVTFKLDGVSKGSFTIAGQGRRMEYLPSSGYGRYAELELSFAGTLNEYVVEYSERMN